MVRINASLKTRRETPVDASNVWFKHLASFRQGFLGPFQKVLHLHLSSFFLQATCKRHDSLNQTLPLKQEFYYNSRCGNL